MSRPAGWARGVWTVGWKSAMFLTLWGILLAPLVISLSGGIGEGGQDIPLRMRLCLESGGALSILAAAWAMARFVDRRPFATLGFARGHVARDLLLGAGLGSAWLALSVAGLWMAGWASPQASAAIHWPVLAWLSLALLCNTLTQEVLARGYIFQTIRSVTGPAWAVALSALLFTLFHAGVIEGSLLPALNVFGAGILFGLAYQLTANLWLPLAVHFAWNFLLGPVLGLAVSAESGLGAGWRGLDVRGPELFTGGAFGIEGGLVVTLTTALAIAAILRIGRRQLATQ